MDLQQRQDDGAWRTVSHGVSNGCLSPPLAIAPGDSLASRLDVWGADRSERDFPTFDTGTIDGEYRLIWHHLRTTYDADAPNFGDTLAVARRTSEPFRLARGN
jgi:hypothetical protein